MQLWDVIVETLGLTPYVKKTHFTSKSENFISYYVDHGRDGFIKHLHTYNIWDPDLTLKQEKAYHLNSSMLGNYIEEGGIVIVNFGLHYKFWNLLDFQRIANRVASLVGEKTKKGTIGIFRNTLHQHFRTASNDGIYANFIGDKNDVCVQVKSFYKHPADIIMEYYAKKYNIKILSDYVIFWERFDLHSEMYNDIRLDCTHYCYTPETAIPQLIMLNRLI